MPHVLSVSTALPAHYADQETLIGAFRDLWGAAHFNPERLEQLHRAVRVGGRHLALPLEAYPDLKSFAARNTAFIRVATDLGEEALRGALEKAGIGPRDLDAIFFVTVTGIATPSIDARLVNRLGLRPDVRRTPIFGLGCVAGAAGLSRANDYARGAPSGVAALLSVELCSLTLQREDMSIPNLIASGLFGDGAAAVLIGADSVQRRGPRVVTTGASFYPDTERVMGWDVVDSGFKVVLSAQVPNVVREHIARDVDQFLGAQGLSRGSVKHFIAHSGGPKVLEAFEAALELPRSALRRSWESLQQVGNLSSASVLFVLKDLLDSGEAQPGDYGLLLAMGPGFCSEMVLLQW